jgi:hypothetical protein
MKKSLFCFMSAIIVNATTIAQQPIIAKVPPMMMMNPLTPDEARSVEAVYDKMLSEAKNVRIINKLVLEKGMRDYQFQQRDWTNAEKTIALGEVLNVSWVVRLQVQKRMLRSDASEIIVTAVLLNIQTQETICATPVIIENVNETQNKLEPLINEITLIVAGGTGGLLPSGQSSAAYKVGTRGPAGGWVFYDKGAYSDGWRYLEVAPRETETSVPRGKYVEKIPGADKAIGSGKRNTELILQSKQDCQIIKAAKICANSELNWFKDWFLPSYSELQWFQLHRTTNFADLSVSYYWTSSGSEDSLGFFGAAGVAFPDRNQPNYLVRAVRAF